MHDTTRPTQADTLEALENLSWALQGTALLMDPDSTLAAEERAHVAALLEWLAAGPGEELSGERRAAGQAVNLLMNGDTSFTQMERGDLAALLTLLARRMAELVGDLLDEPPTPPRTRERDA